MDVGDDLYLGSGFTLYGAGAQNPTLQQGSGPLGRVVFRDIVPLTKQAASLAALQHTTNGTALTLVTGTGITAGTAPDGSAVKILDCPRCLSFTTSADMSAVTLAIVGYDEFWAPMTQNKVLPASATTANSLKAFKYIKSITPNATDGVNNVSVGVADIFGLPFAASDAGYVFSAKWNNTLAQDAGTFVAAVQTIPATALTGDVRGTYAPSSASDGVKRLVIGQHLIGSQCGAKAQKYSYVDGASVTQTGAIGVQQV